ncbi:MAG: prepilin peptidase [Betaproteobacteria bacterium]|nr:MAG: prepilin peptidase [Betaproteobacteria bacterium]
MDSLLAHLASNTVAYVALCAALGLMVGSFLNVVIHRLPKMLERQWQRECAELTGETVAETPRYNLVVPRSSCPACNHHIRPLENIPVASYLRLRGRCSACGAAIPLRYPLVEALSGILTAYVGFHYGVAWTALAAMLFAWAMIALAFIDLDTFYLPDCITLPLIWTGLLAQVFQLFPQVTLQSGVIGAVAGYLALWTVFWTFKLATGKEGMGYGDFKLLAAIGAWLGWNALPLVILLSSLVGAFVGITLIVVRRQGRDVPIPFGPYLVVAGLIALFWGRSITDRYLNLF